MSKPRWHPLPIDSQVVAAIEDRKEKFIESRANQGGNNAQQEMIFVHVCTVLEHAKKIFEMSEDDLCKLDVVDKLKDT